MPHIPLTPWNISVIVVGYLVSTLGGHLIVGPIVTAIWNRHITEKYKRYPELVAYVGVLERFLYTSSILVGQSGFIAIWLALKLAGQWTPTKTSIDRPLYHIFLIGNALSLIIGVGAALVMQSLLRP